MTGHGVGWIGTLRSDTCVCPVCGKHSEAKSGRRCLSLKCPECGNKLMRGSSKKELVQGKNGLKLIKKEETIEI